MLATAAFRAPLAAPRVEGDPQVFAGPPGSPSLGGQGDLVGYPVLIAWSWEFRGQLGYRYRCRWHLFDEEPTARKKMFLIKVSTGV